MTARLLVALGALALSGCPTDGLPDGVPLPEGPFAVVATSDYVDTVLATIDLETMEAADQVAAVASGDVLVQALDEDLALLVRNEGLVQRFRCGALASAPDLELATGAGSNPHAAVLCGDSLFVSNYNANEIDVFDPVSGELLESIDVSAHAEPGGDGQAEPATLLVDGDRLHAVLERYDHETSLPSDQAMVLTIDCATRAVLDEQPAPPNSQAWLDPTGEADLLVRYGGWFELDGGVARYDLEAGQVAEALVDEAELGADITDVAVAGEHLALASWDWEDQGFGVHCLDLATGGLTDAALGLEQNIWTLEAAPTGDVWVFLTLTTGADDAHGIAELDPVTCTLSPEPRWTFGLQPTGAAFLPGCDQPGS